MRIAALVAAASLALLACAGEVAPDAAKSRTSAESAEPPPAASSSSGTPSAASSTTTDDSAVTCFVEPGAPAPGECTVGAERDCPDDVRPMSSGGPAGYCKQRCMNVNGTATWSEPTIRFECPYTDTSLFTGAENPKCVCNTPLVLSFDNRHVTFLSEQSGSFDLSRLGISHGSDWPTAATPWLALDRNGNGTIDDGGELFGSATPLATGAFARNGFDALRDLDANHDGSFDAADAAFTRVVVWSDRNADRVSTPNELTPLAAMGVTAISLADHAEPRCDARRNCEGERATFTFGDGQRGTVIDVYLPAR